MSKMLVVVVLFAVILTASLALADPYFSKPSAPAPAAKPAPAPAATTTPPPPTEGAPAKDGKAPPTTKATPAPAATTSSSFLGQPGEIGAWDTHGNPVTKPAFLASPDAEKVRTVVKGMNPVFEPRYKGDINAARNKLREMRSAICKAFDLNEKTRDWDLIQYAAAQYEEAKQGVTRLYIWNFVLSLALIAMGIWCWRLQTTKHDCTPAQTKPS